MIDKIRAAELGRKLTPYMVDEWGFEVQLAILNGSALMDFLERLRSKEDLWPLAEIFAAGVYGEGGRIFATAQDVMDSVGVDIMRRVADEILRLNGWSGDKKDEDDAIKN